MLMGGILGMVIRIIGPLNQSKPMTIYSAMPVTTLSQFLRLPFLVFQMATGKKRALAVQNRMSESCHQ